MSTRDAAELEPSVVGGESDSPPRGTANATRTPTARQNCQQSVVRQEGKREALTFRPRKEEEEEEEAVGPRFTSCIFLRLSGNAGLDRPAPRPKKRKPDSCRRSLTEPQRVEDEDGSSQVNGKTSPTNTFIDVASDYPLPETTLFPGKKEENVVCNELDTARDLSLTQTFSNRDFGLLEHNELFTLPCASQQRGRKLEEDRKDYTKPENHTDFEEPSKSDAAMLSSTVVTVLAPQWNGRPRRTKRFEASGNLEVHVGLQDVTNTEVKRVQERFQETLNRHGVERMFADGSHGQLRVPFLGTRRNTVGWSSKSGPASLDYGSNRKMVHSASLDLNSGRMNNRRTDVPNLSPIATTLSPVSPLSLDPNEHKRNLQTGHQGGLSSLSSKPTTSSLLLSLRRLNSSSRITSPTSTLSPPLSSSPNDQDGKLFATHLSQSFFNNNEQEKVKPLHSTSSISYRTTETGPIVSPSSSNYRERDTPKTCYFSSSTGNNITEDTPFTQQPQTINKSQSSLSCSKQTSRGPLEIQKHWGSSDKRTNMFSEGSISSSRHSPYDSSVMDIHSVPRRTTLTSTSWWKQATPESSSLLTLNDTTNMKNKPNTVLSPPCNDNSHFGSAGPTDNKRFSQIPNNRNNNNTTHSPCKGNMNLVIKTQSGTQRNTEDSLDHESDGLVKQKYGFSLNVREAQKPNSLPDVLSSSKISRATARTKLTQHNNLNKHDASSGSFTANVTELPPTLLNLKSSGTLAENSSKYKNNHCPPKTNNNPVSQQPTHFTKKSFSLESSNPLNSQGITSKCVYGLPLTQNGRTSPSFQCHPSCSQTNMPNALAYTGSSSQTSKLKTTATATTSLGFERSYASIPKPIHPKSVSSLIPTVSTLSKTNYSPVSTSIHPEGTTSPGPSLLTPPITPASSSSPTIITSSTLLTPPATPNIISPIYSESSSPKEESIGCNSLERDSKKLQSRAEGKKVRRVTWEDSVDPQHSEPSSMEKSDLSRIPTSSLSPRSVTSPSIFSFLRSTSPTTNTSHVCNPTTKTSNIEVGRGGKYRSLSSDSDLTSVERERTTQRPGDMRIFDQGRRELTTPRQERTLSVESGTAQCRSSAPLPIDISDISSGYMLRYSSPPYSTLMSNRSMQGETKKITPRSPLFQQPSEPHYTPHLFFHNDPVADVTIPLFEQTPSPIGSPQPLSIPFGNKISFQDSSLCSISHMDQVNNNHCKNISQDLQNSQILLVDNRVHISSKSLDGDRADNSSRCVTETLVYSIKSKVNTAAPKNTRPELLQRTANTPVTVETKLSQQLHTAQSEGAATESLSHSNQSSSGSSSTESQSLDDESSNRKNKENVMGKSRFFSMEGNNEQSQKRSRFVLKKSVSTPNSNLTRSDSERANKTNRKMDQVLNKLKQTFSTKRSDDDVSFPWKWKRSPQTASVGGLRDISDAPKVLEEREPGQEVVLQNNEKRIEENRWSQNRYAPIPSLKIGNTMEEDEFCVWPDKSPSETAQEDESSCAEHMSESKTHPHLKIPSPTTQEFDLNTGNRIDYKQRMTNQFLSCRDPSPGRGPNPTGGHPAQFRKSTPSPRSPFSPFASLSPLSPLSPFSSPDVLDDCVFYSPKLQRHRGSSSPCEPGEAISLVGPRRSRASTGPPSAGPGPDKEHLSSSYADLKYGIDPGRSFSVSSVLSSRPSGPGRISTGSRFMSMGDLSESASAYGESANDLDNVGCSPQYDRMPTGDGRTPHFSSVPGKMRSRSLPRSLTRRLANWSSETSASLPATSKPTRLWSPDMNTCHFAWDTEGPPTPPPTPPLSPVSKRISKPPSLSSPTLPVSSGAPQDSQSSRGHLPSRGYVSSLSTFEESSDSSSDTTTDDEYYLETGADEDKETEL